MGMFSSGSAKRAAQVQASAIKDAILEIEKGKEEYLPNFDPYIQAGQAAIPQYNAALDTTQGMISGLDSRFDNMYGQVAALQPQVDEMYLLSQQQDPIVQDILSGGQGFTTSPGYEFRFDEGLRGVESSQAAQGMLDSGSTGKALVEYGQGVASDEFDKYMNRQYNALNAVGTQLGGRQAALGAGQSQITSGLNIAGQELNQITAQQNLNNQYQSLINQGYTAAQAQAALGMDAQAQLADQYLARGNVYAGGMMAKDAELKAQGAAVLQAGATAAGAIVGGPMGAKIGSQIGGAAAGGLTGGGGQPMMPMITSSGNTGYSTPQYTDIGNQMPWLNSPTTASNPALANNNIMSQEMARAQSGYNTNLTSSFGF